jgi:hypothetical protein
MGVLPEHAVRSLARQIPRERQAQTTEQLRPLLVER